MISKLKYAEKKGIEKGIEEGMEKGIEEGTINKAREMATELIKDGAEVSLVVKYTKLTEDEVEKLKKKLNG